MINFVFMLTHSDATIPGAIDYVEPSAATGLRYIGFKDVGADPQTQRLIARAAKDAGLETMLEVVSVTVEDEMRSVEAALAAGVEWILGGTNPDAVLPLLAGSGVRYCPFPGRVVGHPSVLEGSIGQIAPSAADLTARDGVHGLDLLAYRHATADIAAAHPGRRRRLGRSGVAAGSVDVGRADHHAGGGGRVGVHDRQRDLRRSASGWTGRRRPGAGGPGDLRRVGSRRARARHWVHGARRRTTAYGGGPPGGANVMAARRSRIDEVRHGLLADLVERGRRRSAPSCRTSRSWPPGSGSAEPRCVRRSAVWSRVGTCCAGTGAGPSSRCCRAGGTPSTPRLSYTQMIRQAGMTPRRPAAGRHRSGRPTPRRPATSRCRGHPAAGARAAAHRRRAAGGLLGRPGRRPAGSGLDDADLEPGLYDVLDSVGSRACERPRPCCCQWSPMRGWPGCSTYAGALRCNGSTRSTSPGRDPGHALDRVARPGHLRAPGQPPLLATNAPNQPFEGGLGRAQDRDVTVVGADPELGPRAVVREPLGVPARHHPVLPAVHHQHRAARVPQARSPTAGRRPGCRRSSGLGRSASPARRR